MRLMHIWGPSKHVTSATPVPSCDDKSFALRTLNSVYEVEAQSTTVWVALRLLRILAVPARFTERVDTDAIAAKNGTSG